MGVRMVWVQVPAEAKGITLTLERPVKTPATAPTSALELDSQVVVS